MVSGHDNFHNNFQIKGCPGIVNSEFCIDNFKFRKKIKNTNFWVETVHHLYSRWFCWHHPSLLILFESACMSTPPTQCLSFFPTRPSLERAWPRSPREGCRQKGVGEGVSTVGLDDRLSWWRRSLRSETGIHVKEGVLKNSANMMAIQRRGRRKKRELFVTCQW